MLVLHESIINKMDFESNICIYFYSEEFIFYDVQILKIKRYRKCQSYSTDSLLKGWKPELNEWTIGLYLTKLQALLNCL